ncbi:uncharacterized protein G2W53_040363 [Senna tora]|uniref:Uncharacterized protein n=1 Tax=Senna tora TaxID=362788 RepID=A0A834SDF6_9FABA|nr:uncharacterized protein G2W53_040363 [Senna tora]
MEASSRWYHSYGNKPTVTTGKHNIDQPAASDLGVQGAAKVKKEIKPAHEETVICLKVMKAKANYSDIYRD